MKKGLISMGIAVLLTCSSQGYKREEFGIDGNGIPKLTKVYDDGKLTEWITDWDGDGKANYTAIIDKQGRTIERDVTFDDGTKGYTERLFYEPGCLSACLIKREIVSADYGKYQWTPSGGLHKVKNDY